MSLDDALMLAGQVLADYDASGLADVPGAERIWPGRLANALRDLLAAAAGYDTELAGAVRQVQDATARMGAEVARLDRAELAARRAGCARPGRVRDALARLVWSRAARVGRRVPEPGAVVLSAGEADTAWQALADAAAWRAGRAVADNGCFGCVRARANAHGLDPDLARCPEHARDDTIVADYAALRLRLGGDRR
jgi:hypothetical protein